MSRAVRLGSAARQDGQGTKGPLLPAQLEDAAGRMLSPARGGEGSAKATKELLVCVGRLQQHGRMLPQGVRD